MTILMQHTSTHPAPSAQRPSQGVFRHFCVRCGSSRCRDEAKHAASGKAAGQA